MATARRYGLVPADLRALDDHLGYGFKRVIVDPLIKHGVIPLVIADVGAFDRGQVDRACRVQRRGPSFPSPFSRDSFALGGINISYADIGTLVVAGLIVIGLQTF